MPEQNRRTTTQRTWPLVPIDAETTPVLWATHEVTVKDVGTPQEVTEHQWTLDCRFPRVGRDTERQKVVLALTTDQAGFDAALNVIRQAMVDARTWTQAGGP